MLIAIIESPHLFVVWGLLLGITIYAACEHGLPRHPRAAAAALVFLISLLLADMALFAYGLIAFARSVQQ